MSDFKIIPLHQDHYQGWLELYQGYAEHYQVSLTKEGIAVTWGWLMDAEHPTTGLVAVSGDDLLGLAHYRAMPSPLRGAEIGFLDDLFVRPNARGSNIGDALLEELKVIAQQRNWPVIRWITRDNNYRARGLYDRLAVKTDWNTYEMVSD